MDEDLEEELDLNLGDLPLPLVPWFSPRVVTTTALSDEDSLFLRILFVGGVFDFPLIFIMAWLGLAWLGLA